jgi:hypothetical protein
MIGNIVYVIGTVNQEKKIFEMLGSCFLIKNNGTIVTSMHVIQNKMNLAILKPDVIDLNLNSYQDTTNKQAHPITVEVIEVDPIRDIAILKADLTLSGALPDIDSFDNICIGEDLLIFGFPHCSEPNGRKVLTFQKAVLGAKVLLECNSIKVKHGVVNIQSRPGQSGSIIMAAKNNKIVGMLIGTFAPSHGVIINGINPAELNQTTHCISAEYIKNLSEEI